MLSYDLITFFQEQLRRVERKNRDEFRKMLEVDTAAGALTAKTSWREYCGKVHSLFSDAFNNKGGWSNSI